MRILKMTLFVFLALTYLGCTTSRAVIADSANLANYNYATIANVMGYGGSPFLMDMEVQVFNALLTTRLTVIGDREIGSLAESQRQQLLLVRFSANQQTNQFGTVSTVAINFVEYITGRPVVSFTGTSEVGMSAALNSATTRMQNMF